jgi:hypothetical protein
MPFSGLAGISAATTSGVEHAAAAGDAADRVDKVVDVGHPVFQQVTQRCAACTEQVERATRMDPLRQQQDSHLGIRVA